MKGVEDFLVMEESLERPPIVFQRRTEREKATREAQSRACKRCQCDITERAQSIYLRLQDG
jgi:hypothetical protein